MVQGRVTADCPSCGAVIDSRNRLRFSAAACEKCAAKREVCRTCGERMVPLKPRWWKRRRDPLYEVWGCLTCFERVERSPGVLVDE